MTTEDIKTMQTKTNIKLETARKIRELLDQAAEEYRKAADDESAWEDDDMESEVWEVVTG